MLRLLATLAPLAFVTPAASIQTLSAPVPGPTSTIVLREDFEDGSLDSWEQAPENGRYSISNDPRRVSSGRYSLQALYTSKIAYGMLTRWFMPGFDELYVRYRVMFEEGFVNPGMHFFVLAGNRIDNKSSAAGKGGVKPSGEDFFYAGVDPEYVPGDSTLRPLHFYTYWPEMSCCYGNRFLQTSPRTPVDSQWHEIVIHIKLNTPGRDNGSQTLWIDGQKKIDVQDLRWRTTGDLRLNQIRFDNWMEASPKTQHIWVDDIIVWRP